MLHRQRSLELRLRLRRAGGLEQHAAKLLGRPGRRIVGAPGPHSEEEGNDRRGQSARRVSHGVSSLPTETRATSDESDASYRFRGMRGRCSFQGWRLTRSVMRFIMAPGDPIPLQRSAMAYVIKRYSNRKLYDTQESRYVTLEEIEEMIRTGKEISVVDAASGEDLTGVTLTQIILENQRSHRGGLPTGFLHQLIKHGEAWQDFLQRSMKSSLEGVVSNQREMERVFQEWMSRAGWGSLMPASGLGARAEPKRGGAEADADRLREEVAALRERLKSLEERLEERQAQAK